MAYRPSRLRLRSHRNAQKSVTPNRSCAFRPARLTSRSGAVRAEADAVDADSVTHAVAADRRPEARFAMLSTAWSCTTDPFWTGAPSGRCTRLYPPILFEPWTLDFDGRSFSGRHEHSRFDEAAGGRPGEIANATISLTRKKPRGRPPTGAESIHLRLLPDQLAALDQWIAHQSDMPSRPEAVRRLLVLGLTVTSKKW
jgi:hypothetical protein